jgi:MoaD family protein
MEIEVMIFGRLRDLAGVTKENVAVAEGAKLTALMSVLNSMHGDNFKKEVAGTRGLRILVNGREFELLAGMETPLKDKDSVVVLPPIEGG